MSDLVGNPNCWFSHAKAQICVIPDNHPQFLGDTHELHHENMPMQYTEICFSAVKTEIFSRKNDIFLIFAQNIDCAETILTSTHNL